jgi:hypothetical protein
MKNTFVAAMSVAALLFTSSAASAQVCAVGVMVAAISASVRDNRELTKEEASTCGLLFLFEAPNPKKKVDRRAKKH